MWLASVIRPAVVLVIVALGLWTTLASIVVVPICGGGRAARGETMPHLSQLGVLYEDGSVKFENRETLGLARGAAIVVGPDSSHPALARLVWATDTGPAWAPPVEGYRRNVAARAH